jgi:hypothetical protein
MALFGQSTFMAILIVYLPTILLVHQNYSKEY